MAKLDKSSQSKNVSSFLNFYNTKIKTFKFKQLPYLKYFCVKGVKSLRNLNIRFIKNEKFISILKLIQDNLGKISLIDFDSL